MAIIGTGGTSYPDFYICLFLLTLTLISSVLNSLVIRHNFLKPPSLPRTLFLLLAISDLLASIYIPIDYSIGGLSPRDIDECTSIFTEKFCNDYYMATFKPASVSDRVRSAIRQILTLMPCYITGLLATTRFLQIKYPLREIKEQGIFGFLIFSLFYMCSIFVVFFRAGDEENSSVIAMPVMQGAWNMQPSLFGKNMQLSSLYLILVCFVLLLQVIAVLTSILTVWELRKMFLSPMSDIARRNSLSGSLKILISNIGSIIAIIVLLYKAFLTQSNSKKLGLESKINKIDVYENAIKDMEDSERQWFFGFIVIHIAILPLVLSTLNPAIYIIFTPESRSWKSKVQTARAPLGKLVRRQG